MAQVLIVDDKEDNRDIYKNYLELKGYDTLEATNGDDAIRVLSEATPDIILLDIAMPDNDNGIRFLNTLIHSGLINKYKIIVLSIRAFQPDVEAICTQYAIPRYAAPATSMAEITRKIKEMLEEKR